MEAIKETPSNILEFNPDTLFDVRKKFNLDKPGRMEDAINILEDWIKKQDHFMIKDFDRDYLERMIIRNKGLMERVKKRLDALCTYRTLMPEYFKPYNLREDFLFLNTVPVVAMPKLTPDNYRILVAKDTTEKFTPSFFDAVYKRSIIMTEFLTKYDYSAGYEIIIDFSQTNVTDAFASFNMADLQKISNIWLGGFSYRVKYAHCKVPESKVVDTFFTLIKSVFSSKIISRIILYKDFDDINKYLPIDLLPADFGGKENSIDELYRQFVDVLSSEDHMEYLKKTTEMRTDETVRTVEQFNEIHLGTPGTFRTLVVD